MDKIYSLPSKFIFTLFFLAVFSISFAQTPSERSAIKKSYNLDAIAQLEAKAQRIDKQNQTEVLAYIQANNVPLVRETTNGGIAILTKIIDNKPIYLTTDNAGAATTTNTDALFNGGSLNLNVEGQDMTIGIWDGGIVRPTHEIFNGRVTQVDNPSGISNHATHVAGTLVGNGDVQAGDVRGMASQASLQANDFNGDFSEMLPQATDGLLVSNHSYGFGADNLPLYFFGAYDDTSAQLDELLFNLPFYTMVCSAGNDRNDGHNPDDNGYDLLTDRSCAKNNITVAAVNEVTDYQNNFSVQMSSFSSWGPTDDGRVKPDISAKGVSTRSSTGGSDAAYSVFSGTSMASPNTAGSLILLQQLHRNLNGGFMKSATLKAMMIHSAKEAGNDDGPDYRFGWGLLDTGAAARLLLNDNFTSDFSENTLQNNATYNQTVNAIGDGTPLVVTVVWTDPAGTVAGETEDDPTPRLVNDLDVRLVDDNGTTIMPWKLDVNNVLSGATQGDNTVDNVEKIEVPAATGSYAITVSHKGTLVNGSQDFSIVISGVVESEFGFTADEVSKTVCNNTNLIYDFNFASLDSYSSTTQLSISGVPGSATATFSPTELTQDGPFSLTLSNLSGVTPGNYPMIVTASGGGTSQDYTINMEVVEAEALGSPTLTSPGSGEQNVFIQPTLTWDEVAGTQFYTVELSSNSDFSSILSSDEVVGTSFVANGLEQDTQYFWRVTPNNSCSQGDMATSNFTTEQLQCEDPITAQDTPMTISTVPNTVSSTLTVPQDANGFIGDVNVTVDVTHTWLSDLTVILTSPAGTSVTLVAGACTNQDDIDATFDDSGVDLSCATTFPALTGVIAPTSPLSAFIGEDSAGDWTLTVDDSQFQDGGSLNEFTLEFCTSSSLSVSDIELADFRIYPNPAKDEFFVSFAEASSKVDVAIFDLNGRKLSSRRFEGNGTFNERMSTTNLSTGIYFVKVTNGDLTSTRKLLVE